MSSVASQRSAQQQQQQAAAARGSRAVPTHMESAVTKLLVATRQLLEALQMWSVVKMSDLEVSDTYVKLGNDFNNAVGAFVQNGVSMDDLLSVPQDLRECLESLLALDPTLENLDIYLPRVRQIIVTLLSGLKAKQALYRKISGGVAGGGRLESGGAGAEGETGMERISTTTDPRQALLAQAEGRHRPHTNGAFGNNNSSSSSRDSVAHSFSGYSITGDREPAAAGRSGSRSPDLKARFGGVQQQQRASQGSRQGTYQHPPTRPDLPPPSQMITTSASSSSSSVPIGTSAGGSHSMDRHLSSSASSTNGSLPSRGARIGAPLPPAPPDAFRPPRRRVTPSGGSGGGGGGETSGARRERERQEGSMTPTPPTPHAPMFANDEQMADVPIVAAAQNRSLPPVPTHSASGPANPTTTNNVPPRSVERERFALRDEPSPSPVGSPTKKYRPLSDTEGAAAAVVQPATPPPRRRSHVSKRSISGESQLGGSTGEAGSAGRRSGNDGMDVGGADDGGGQGQYPMGSRFSLDSEPMDTPKSRRRMTGLTSLSSAGVRSPPLLPPLGDLPSLEEGLSVDTTSRARSASPSPQAIPDTTTTITQAADSPAALASLTALQNSEALGRRASKRFSQYQYKQLLPGHHKGPSSSALRHSRMGSVAEAAADAAGLGDAAVGVAPVPGAQSPVRPARRTVSRTNTNTSIEVPPVPPIPQQMLEKREHDRAEGGGGDDATRIEVPEERVMQIPRIIAPDLDSPTDTVIHHAPDTEAQVAAEAVPVSTSTSGSVADPTDLNTLRVFLQYGRETKKVSLDRREVTSIGDLQGLFMNKFEYAPDGMEMFPDVYIKDPLTGIAYHLEDMDDVKPDVLLSLNIDQLDQVKQHFDNTISGLLHEIKELKHNVSQNRRLSAFKPDHSTLSPSVHPADRPSARSPAKVHVVSRPSSPVPAAASLPNHSHAAPTSTPDLHGQLDDVQSLRRDLGAMRQQYVDFVNQSKTAFQTIRDQTQNMREISMTKLSGSRALLNEGKSALEKDSSEVVRAVEEVSDAIDNVKDDIVRRQILPRPNQMEVMKKNLEEAKAHVEKLKQQVSLVAPAWKSTWNEELSTVLEEQRLLKYHESLATDLEGDITQATGIFATLQQYMAQRQQGVGVGVRRQFRAPVRETEPTVPNLLLEIRTQETDPNRRLRAIEEQQKAREREKAAKQDDEFSTELTGFVAGRKLKKTGGTEEAERLRMKKQEQQFKRMYNDKKETQGGEGAAAAAASPPVTPTSAMSEAGHQGSAPDSPAAVHPEAVEADSSREETG
ncbi:hypothetical protein QFC21_005817 [Naganishia friedmannii]|uniref:Uncharacterized protein n=1 Tax=Naganishia friedmannii TaxID=89922 RepID=A0ACC2V7R2_9TREE|nr:hypothetical protein QFC21_005817 [Naganishia friedmannii]